MRALLLTGLILALPAAAQEANRPGRPNLLVVVTDDQRFDQLGCAGHAVLRTPTIDALAAGGVRFASSFVTTAICAASRASLMTGRSEAGHGYTFGKPPMGEALAADTYFARLRGAGYRTGFVGKWGVRFEDGLTAQLFDDYRALGPPYLKDGEPHLTDRIADAAIEFLEADGSDAPFCLTISFCAPHAEDAHADQYIPPPDLAALYAEADVPPPANAEKGFDALPEFLQQSLGRRRWGWRFDTREKQVRRTKDYWRMITGVDRALGRVMDALDEGGLAQGTVVVFTSDNGYFLGERGLAGKWLIFEESIRVPLIVRDPRLDAARRGAVLEPMVLNVDVAPTLLELAGVEPPVGYEGRSLVPLLRGEKPEWRSDFLYEHRFEHAEIPQSVGVRGERWVYVRYDGLQPAYEQLFDLATDPGELHDLAREAAFADVLAEQRARCDALVAGSVRENAPVIRGLSQRHPLDRASVGRLLLGELRCGACHEGIAPALVPAPAPDLAEVGGRVAPDYLQRFIADPQATHPGTKMPSLLHSLPEGERADVAQAITHFLVSGSSREWSRGEVDARKVDTRAVAAGDDLFHSVGCVACHTPRRPAAGPSAGPGDLAHVPAKFDVDSLAEFLFLPGAARPSGRMPDMGLGRAEARALASYLIGSDPPPSPSLIVRPELVAAGRRYFQEFNCAACHALDGMSAKPPVAVDPESKAGCLGEGGASTPRYRLGAGQKSALAAALQAPAGELSNDERIALTLTAFNCIACHVRDGYGGVRAAVNPYFETDEHDLGDDARIPPPLTLAGAKLQGSWLRKVLFDGRSVRPYMFTRMPRFGEANLAHLPALLERADAGRIEPFEMPLPEGEQARTAREAGRELMGTRGLSCIACHDFNGKPSLTHQGIDLINTTERLRPSWFARFLIAPQTHRPGIVMPDAWSGGVASHTEILGGDTAAQIRAIWFYLSEGRTARDPEGMHSVRTRLVVGDLPRTYRGRSAVAGFRGIAVGFPGGLSYAFDAHNGSLSALWRGEFVSVRWDGQGAGDFVPLGKAIELARDVSFCALTDAAAPWPRRPRMDEHNPVNPDPLYPRNHGYRFRGYQLDRDSIPTLRYASGEVSIEDRSVADTSGARSVLRRTLRFSAPAAQRLFLRALAGELAALSQREFLAPGLRVTIPDVPAVLRTPDEAGLVRELLLELDLPAGPSTITIEYELLD